MSTFFASNNSTNELNLHLQNGTENRSIWKRGRGKGERKQDLSQESEFSFKYFSRYFSRYRTRILKYIVESVFKFIQPDSNFSFYRYTSVHHPSLSPLSRAKCGYSKNTSVNTIAWNNISVIRARWNTSARDADIANLNAIKIEISRIADSVSCRCRFWNF